MTFLRVLASLPVLALWVFALSMAACDGFELERLDALRDEFPHLSEELAQAILAGDCSGLPEDTDVPCLEGQP
jgi:hypothetical protein